MNGGWINALQSNKGCYRQGVACFEATVKAVVGVCSAKQRDPDKAIWRSFVTPAMFRRTAQAQGRVRGDGGLLPTKQRNARAVPRAGPQPPRKGSAKRLKTFARDLPGDVRGPADGSWSSGRTPRRLTAISICAASLAAQTKQVRCRSLIRLSAARRDRPSAPRVHRVPAKASPRMPSEWRSASDRVGRLQASVRFGGSAGKGCAHSQQAAPVRRPMATRRAPSFEPWRTSVRRITDMAMTRQLPMAQMLPDALPHLRPSGGPWWCGSPSFGLGVVDDAKVGLADLPTSSRRPSTQ